MSNSFHRRVITLTYFDLPEFANREEQDEWHRALGRMVAYGLQREAENNTVQSVTLNLDPRGSGDIVGAYLPALQASEIHPEYGFVSTENSRTFYLAEDILQRPYTTCHAFVIGAVKDHDGKYGFHS